MAISISKPTSSPFSSIKPNHKNFEEKKKIYAKQGDVKITLELTNHSNWNSVEIEKRSHEEPLVKMTNGSTFVLQEIAVSEPKSDTYGNPDEKEELESKEKPVEEKTEAKEEVKEKTEAKEEVKEKTEAKEEVKENE